MVCTGMSRGIVACAVALLGLPLQAQQAAPVLPTPAELGERRPAINTDPSRLPQPAPAVPSRLGAPDDDLRFDVAAFTLDETAPAELRAALPALVAPFVGRGKSFADLADAARAVTRHLQSELGYYLGFAYIPEQALQQGEIRIAVLEGRLDEVKLAEPWPDDIPVSKELVQRYLAQLKPGAVLLVGDVERVVFLVNDLRGLSAEFEIQPGRLPGTARLLVRAKAEPRQSYSAELDNANARVLGRERATASVVRNSPFGLGDSLTASVVGAKGLAFGLANYTAPVGASGLRLGVSVSTLKYMVDKQAFPQGLEGTANTVAAFSLYPLRRSRNLNLFVLGTLDAKSYNDFDGATRTPKRVNSISLGLTGDLRDGLGGGGISSLDVQLSSGQVRFDTPPVVDPPDSRFTKLNLRAVRLQSLVPGLLQAYGVLRWQQAFNNLDVTEQFRAGGPDGVRALPPGEGSGDNGVQLSAELRLLLPPGLLGALGGNAFASVFIDWAQVEARHDPSNLNATTVNRSQYGGAGLGLVWSRADGWELRASLAQTFQGEARNEADRGLRAYLTLKKQF